MTMKRMIVMTRRRAERGGLVDNMLTLSPGHACRSPISRNDSDVPHNTTLLPA
ncbi:hypothetical protein [Oryza sativa Japonica Group]|uniref:Uncharacterized protein n=1 Tax=Oryza sativa subsp. japonica TaxID=39947 RepID=Q9ASB2_ORYSJ|nr:hypothetical protein [Oryza sativa Japonica Group]